MSTVPSNDVQVALPDDVAQLAQVGDDKGEVHLVHLYPQQMTAYGDLGNLRCLAARLRWHGYRPIVHELHPGAQLPERVDLVFGGGAPDAGQLQVAGDLRRHADRLRELAADGVPMLVVHGMFQLFATSFISSTGDQLPGLGLLNADTGGAPSDVDGMVVVDTDFGPVVGFKSLAAAPRPGDGQEPFGRLRPQAAASGRAAGLAARVRGLLRRPRGRAVAVAGAQIDGARTGNIIGSDLRGPLLPTNPALADGLLEIAARRATGDWRPESLSDIVDEYAVRAHDAQLGRLQP